MVVSRIRLVLILVIIAALAIPAWILASPLFIPSLGEEETPAGFSSVVATGVFMNGEPGHVSSGEALLLHDGTSYVLRFENFFVTNGPGLYVYLAQGARVTSGDLDLGPLRASQGTSNYPIPGAADPRSFRYVVIWCVPFSVQFGFAALSFA